jgi:hypothetical protein
MVDVTHLNFGDKIEEGGISLLMTVVGPVVQTPEGNHLPHVHKYHRCNCMVMQRWTYKAGPIKSVEITTQHSKKTLWVNWR